MNQEEQDQTCGQVVREYTEMRKRLDDIEKKISYLTSNASHILGWIRSNNAIYQEAEKTFGNGVPGNVMIIRNSTPWPTNEELGALITQRTEVEKRLTEATKQLRNAGIPFA